MNYRFASIMAVLAVAAVLLVGGLFINQADAITPSATEPVQCVAKAGCPMTTCADCCATAEDCAKCCGSDEACKKCCAEKCATPKAKCPKANATEEGTTKSCPKTGCPKK